MATAVGPASSRGVVIGYGGLISRRAAEWPTVTVTILAFNRREALRETLTRTLAALDYPAEALGVVVVDNASGDGTSEMLAREFPSVHVIRLPHNMGVSGWNEAFAVATGDWCLILDDDCWVDGNALKRAVAAAEANRADLVSFQVRSGIDPDYYFTEANTLGLFGFWGCALLARRSALAALRGYDPLIFIWGHEVEFMMRFLSAGYRHLYLPDVVAVHMKPPLSEAFTANIHRTNLRHSCYTAAKLLTPTDAIRVLARLFLVIPLDLVARSPRALRSLPAMVAGVIDGLRVREPVRAEVSAAYRDHFMSFANPMVFLRTPRQRWQSRRSTASAISQDAAARFEGFRQRRPRYYPGNEPGVLQI